MASKFKCAGCNEEFPLSTVTTAGGYFLAKGFPHKKIKAACMCGSEDLSIVADASGLQSVQLGKFSSMGPNEKRAFLKKRSHRDYDKNIKAVKLDMHKNYKP